MAEADANIPVASELDIVTARQQGRALAQELGFSPGNATLVATAISELARNIVLYVKRGEVVLRQVNSGPVPGLVVIARDEGPGIADIRRAVMDGYSTSGRLGLGLPGVKRLMDCFEIQSKLGSGTTVVVTKWKA